MASLQEIASQAYAEARAAGLSADQARRAAEAAAASAVSFESPFGPLGDRLTSGFGARSRPGGFGSAFHRGVDMSIGPSARGMPVQTTAPGTVSFAGQKGGYGNVVDVNHPNGMSSRYAHLDDISVAIGDEIAANTPIGQLGNTGRSTGPHLHFEMRAPNGKALDPRSIIDFAAAPSVPTPQSRPTGILGDPIGEVLAAADPEAQTPFSSFNLGQAPAPTSLTSFAAASAPVSVAGQPAGPQGPLSRNSFDTGYSPQPLDAPTMASFDTARFGGPLASPAPTANFDMARFGAPVATPTAPSNFDVGRFADPSAVAQGYSGLQRGLLDGQLAVGILPDIPPSIAAPALAPPIDVAAAPPVSAYVDPGASIPAGPAAGAISAASPTSANPTFGASLVGPPGMDHLTADAARRSKDVNSLLDDVRGAQGRNAAIGSILGLAAGGPVGGILGFALANKMTNNSRQAQALHAFPGAAVMGQRDTRGFLGKIAQAFGINPGNGGVGGLSNVSIGDVADRYGISLSEADRAAFGGQSGRDVYSGSQQVQDAVSSGQAGLW